VDSRGGGAGNEERSIGSRLPGLLSGPDADEGRASLRSGAADLDPWRSAMNRSASLVIAASLAAGAVALAWREAAEAPRLQAAGRPPAAGATPRAEGATTRSALFNGKDLTD